MTFSYVVVVPTEEELKKFGYNQASLNHVLNGVCMIYNRFWEAFIIDFNMQEADVDIMAIAIQAEQLDRIDFSYPIGLNPFRMIVPAPVEKSRLFAFIRPFQPKVQIS